MNKGRARVWAGADVGKRHHWISAVDEDGAIVWSQKVVNDEAAIVEAVGTVSSLAPQVQWAVDMSSTPAALLLAILAAQGQHVVYVPGRVVHSMAKTYQGEGKTDARDAFVIAETARQRRNLQVLNVPAQLVSDLRLFTSHRTDLIQERTRTLNRLRNLLTGVFPALERAFDYASHKGAVILLTGYQTPDAIRRLGQARLTAWLRKRDVRNPHTVAQVAIDAARAQRTSVPGQVGRGRLVAELATQVLAMNDRIAELEKTIAAVFRSHPQAAIIESMPGFGPLLGAELIVAAGDFSTYANAGRLAAAAGLVPVPHESGDRSGNRRRPRRYNRPLLRAFYMSAMSSLRHDGPNRRFYLKKREEGQRHVQAVIALARRRVDVLWALLRDERAFQPHPPNRSSAAY